MSKAGIHGYFPEAGRNVYPGNNSYGTDVTQGFEDYAIVTKKQQ
jgi:hypothetical protein